MTIELSLPDKDLSPNARVHWSRKSRAVHGYRTQAHCAAMDAGGGHQQWKLAKARATFYWPDKRRRDKDNAQAMLKSAYDGIVDAGVLIDDEGITHMPCEFKYDKNNPRVVIVLTGQDQHKETNQ